METNTFIENYREAFGEKAKLPFAFWYSDSPATTPERVNGCMFKALPKIHSGDTVSFDSETLGCMGGKFYSGFIPMPEFLPGFVSGKEKYKQSPETVLDFLDRVQVAESEKPYINFARIDKVDSLDSVEAVVFIASPDMLSGLTTWAYLDNNDDGTVTSIFGSGCSNIITMAVNENRKNGSSTFLGGFDPSVRPYFEADELSLAIPMSRFRVMYDTMRQSCLFGTHAWEKVKNRINGE